MKPTRADTGANCHSVSALPVPSDPAKLLARVLAAFFTAAQGDPQALKDLASQLVREEDRHQLPDNPIDIDADTRVVPNSKGHDAMKTYGPYPHGDRWRVVTRQGRKQGVLSFPTERDATAELIRLRSAAARQANISTEKAVDAYAVQLRKDGLKESSIATAAFRLKALLRPVLGEPLATVTPFRARELYASLSVAVDTRLNVLALAKNFGRDALENGWTDVALWTDIKPQGRRKCGKPKLGLDESRRFMATCLRLAESENPRTRSAAIAAAMLLLFGLRSGEVLGLVVRNLDDGGRLLRITASKTRAGIRVLTVPDWFRPLLLSLVENLPPDARIFPREKTWLHHHVVAICKEAGVTRVVPHGLRGTHADLSLVAAATPLQVSQALGHTSTAVTFRHYASRDLAVQQQQEHAAQALGPSQPLN
jgi:integrase